MPLGLMIYHASGEFKPRIEYDAKAGRLKRIDQSPDGQIVKFNLTMSQPAFAWDLGTIETGWLNFQKATAPSIVVVPFGQPWPARPDNAHKAGFRSRIWDGQEPFAREFAATAGVTIKVIEAFFDNFETAPEAAAGQIPVLRFVNVVESGKNYAPVFDLVRWIERREDIFGPRTVAAPGQPPIAYTPPAPPMAQPAAVPAPGPWGAPPAPPTASVWGGPAQTMPPLAAWPAAGAA